MTLCLTGEPWSKKEAAIAARGRISSTSSSSVPFGSFMYVTNAADNLEEAREMTVPAVQMLSNKDHANSTAAEKLSHQTSRKKSPRKMCKDNRTQLEGLRKVNCGTPVERTAALPF